MASKAKRRSIAALAILVLMAALLFVLATAPSRRQINSYGDCRNAGYPVQESYPEVCRTPDGRSFTNPAQALP
jgi:hypothetical protein